MSYRRPTRREQPDRTDDWLMTYADMITLLLCFFAIFLSVSIPKKTTGEKAQVTQTMNEAPVAQGAVQVAAHPLAAPLPEVMAADKAAQYLAEAGLPARDAEDPVKDETASAAVSPIPDAGTNITVVAAEQMPPTAPIKTPDPVSLPEIVNQLKAQNPQDAASLEQSGDRITTLEISSATFFDSGAATLRPGGRAVLQDVAANLKDAKYDGYQITVEGHTDDTPIKTVQFPSNWELSTARAAAVVHFFLDQGIPAQKLRAAGYADTFPKLPNRQANGAPLPANQAQNRRVVIKLEKIEKNLPATPPQP